MSFLERRKTNITSIRYLKIELPKPGQNTNTFKPLQKDLLNTIKKIAEEKSKGEPGCGASVVIIDNC